VKGYLESLPLRRTTLEKLAAIDANDLMALASYVHAAGDSMEDYLGAPELAKLRAVLELRLTPEEKARVTATVPKYPFGARMD
jgi:hypothetical protein